LAREFAGEAAGDAGGDEVCVRTSAETSLGAADTSVCATTPAKQRAKLGRLRSRLRFRFDRTMGMNYDAANDWRAGGVGV